jgi:hypothetical protein
MEQVCDARIRSAARGGIVRNTLNCENAKSLTCLLPAKTLHRLAKRHDIRRHAGVAGPTVCLVVRPGIGCPTSCKRIGEACGPLGATINFSRIIDEQMDDPRGTAISTLTRSQAARDGRSRGPAPSDLTEASSPRRLSGAACPRSA